MATAAVIALVRLLLVILFFPFSALDKILNFDEAVEQAKLSLPAKLAPIAIVAALFIEISMPLLILTGIADRAAAVVMAGYCILTALLWKQFWAAGDFFRKGKSEGRLIFWDFLKNFSLAGGFLLLFVGVHGDTQRFFDHPLGSSHPYEEVK